MPLGGGASGIEAFRPVPVSGVTAKLDTVPKADGDRAAARLTFDKPGEERRFLALERPLTGLPSGTRALALRYRVILAQGGGPRLALIVFEKGGGVWFKVGATAAPSDEFSDGRLSVLSLSQAAFSDDESGKLEWDSLDKVWFGLILDGPAKGSFEISDARLTSVPYKPTEPLRITGDGPGTWTVGKDPAAKGEVTTSNEGPEGKPCMKFDFLFPAGRHMYGLPSVPVPQFDLEGYTALRLTYKSILPDGLQGLLISVLERDGSQYCAEPPGSVEWTTITLPFAELRLGGWSKDENDQLDLDQIGSVIVGTHGTAKVAAPGVIWAADLQFVP